jgi:2-polyprenyl-3-methyl-5-hydroxy-6-metoxy-1,4-benzoquinol methylase
MSEAQHYPLGYSEQEARRLADQGALLEDLTEDMLRRAGLRQGMQVLDIGCGVGDVSLLAARLVGSDGSVLGIDKALSSVETARRRVAAVGVGNARFEESDLAVFETEQKFDAIVGRLVLLYLPDPATVLRSLSRHLRPHAIVALQEFDMSQVSQEPASDLFMQTRRWILEAFRAGGAELDMGTKLYTTFLRAGLPAPNMIAATHVACGPTSPGYEYMARVLRSLLPLIERSRIANVAEIDIDTLAARLRDDAVANERVSFLPRVVGAWARLSQAPPDRGA